MHIVVLGGGPGGYSAAFEAARLGAQVTLIEKEYLGGTCLNWGCVPTKTILRTARIAWDARNAAEFGLRLPAADVDEERLLERKQGIVEDLRAQIEATAKRLKVDVIYGEGRLTAPRTVRVTTEGTHRDIEGDAIILATGSEVFKLPSIDHSLERVWTSDEATSVLATPDSILIVGGGVIGLEFACAYASFGAQVTVVELMPAVLPGNDKRVQKAAQSALEAMGVTFYLGQAAESIGQFGDRMITTMPDGTMIETDYVLSAVGRKPLSEGFGFPEAGIEMDRAAVKVDAHFRTNVAGVFAIGDLIGGMMLAHVAEEEGVVAARNAVRAYEFSEAEGLLAKLKHLPLLESVDYSNVPACVYTFPEIGVLGSSRDSAKEAGLDVVQAVSKFAANGKALGEGESEGFVQIVAEKGSGRIVGCQIVGPHAVEIIHEVALAKRHGLKVQDIAETIHAHPTVSEVIKLACADAAGKCAG
ncbi:MAG: dihydrolipoyl dehydrogenase [Coriobacteriia bacterium]|nr:dihydrolipoyl dehydrogenase [Coriobacteriia bacterium]